MKKNKEPVYFEHYCCVKGCNRWGMFGIGVYGRRGIKGKWYCGEHYRDACRKIEEDKRCEKQEKKQEPIKETGKQGLLL